MINIAFSFVWAWYNTAGTPAWVNFSAGNLIGFYGTTTYASKVQVAAYNVGMHLRTAIGTDTDACAANHMTGIQYVAAGTCKVNGGTTVDLNTVTTLESIRIHFTDGATSVSTENGIFWSYDAATDVTPPVEVTAKGAEQADTTWTACGGSAAAVTLADQGAAVDHYFYVIMSASPTTVGEKTDFAWKIQIDYF